MSWNSKNSLNIDETMDDTSFENGDVDDESTFNILIATDIHLGFMEKHPLRGMYLNEC